MSKLTGIRPTLQPITGEPGELVSIGQYRSGGVLYGEDLHYYQCADCGTDYPLIDGAIRCNGRGIIKCLCATNQRQDVSRST